MDRRRALIWYGLSLLWMGLIYRASATPDLRALPWVQWLGLLPANLALGVAAILELILRKGAHMVSFGILAGLVRGGLATGIPSVRSGHQSTVAFIFATLYAVSDEWHQGLVPTRSGRPLDVLIDAAGAVIGLLIVSLVRRRHREG